MSSVSVSVQRLLALRHSITHSNQKSPQGLGTQTGIFIGRRRGQGTEFDDLRPYQAGDDIRRVDWRTSARTKNIYTRLYREEKDSPVLIVNDLRDSMFTGSQTLRSVLACELSARLMWQAVSGGSRVNLLCFGDRTHSFTEPASGTTAAINGCRLLAQQFQAIQHAISRQPSSPTASKSVAEDTWQYTDKSTAHPELTDAFRWVMQQHRKGCAVIWVSGMDNPGERFEALLGTLRTGDRHAFVLIDEPLLNIGLPPGYYGYKTNRGKLETKQSINIDRRKQRAIRAALEQTKLSRETLFAKLKIPLLTYRNGSTEILEALRNNGYLP